MAHRDVVRGGRQPPHLNWDLPSVTGTYSSSPFGHAIYSARAGILIFLTPSCPELQPRTEIPGVHASVRGQRDGCQQDAGSIAVPGCPSQCRARLQVRQLAEPRHHQNHVPRRPRRPAVKQATGGMATGQAVTGEASGWNTVPSTQIR